MSDGRCDGYRELASAYVDEQLERDELLRLEQHLKECSNCREFEAGVRRLRELVQAGEAFRAPRRPPPGFAAAVMARLALEAGGQAVPFPVRRPSRSWVAMAVAAAAAAVFFVWSWQRLLPVEPAEQQAAVRVSSAPAEEGSMESYLRQHTIVARGLTPLGSAEEVEFADYRGPARGR